MWFGNNDSARYALIKASGTGSVATSLLQIHLTDEAKRNSLVWFARVPTETNISDVTILRGWLHILSLLIVITAIRWRWKDSNPSWLKWHWWTEILIGGFKIWLFTVA